MKLGFIGTGTITNAIIQGILSSDYPVDRIFLSRRSTHVSRELGLAHKEVRILDRNENIIDASDLIFFRRFAPSAR